MPAAHSPLYFRISSLHRLRPAPFHPSVVVVYLHLASARRKRAQPFDRRGLCASFLHFSDASLNLNPQISSHHTFLTFIVHPAFLLFPSPQPRLSLIYYPTIVLLLIRFFFNSFSVELLFHFLLQKHLPFPGELSREGHFISFGRKLICQREK